MLWEYVLDPLFLITAGLVLAAFAPLIWSIWETWQAND
jgi:hypothetical protein